MPYNELTNRLEALFNFVDEFSAGEPANRADFDQALLDIIASVNAMEETRESASLAVVLADKRYLGRVSSPPTQRSDGTPLQAGDFYNNSATSRQNLFYIWNGSAFLIVSDFSEITAYFQTLSAAPNAATLRGFLELGSASLQNTDAFATVASVSALANALLLASGGLAKSLTDWDSAHTTGPGCGFFAGSAAALNAPAALNTVGVYLAYDANSGVIFASTPSTKDVYSRTRSAGVWQVGWSLMPKRDSIISGASIDTVLIAANPGVDFYRIGASVTALPAGTGEGDLVICNSYDANDAAQLILTRDKRLFLRGQVAGVTSAWIEALITGPFALLNFNGEVEANVSGTYVRAATIVTLTLLNHGHLVGHVIDIDFTSGAAVDGEFTVATVVDANTLTVVHGTSGATSGNFTLRRRLIRKSKNIHSVSYLSAGNYWVNFLAAAPDANYCVAPSVANSTTSVSGYRGPGGISPRSFGVNGFRILTFNITTADVLDDAELITATVNLIGA